MAETDGRITSKILSDIAEAVNPESHSNEAVQSLSQTAEICTIFLAFLTAATLTIFILHCFNILHACIDFIYLLFDCIMKKSLYAYSSATNNYKYIDK